MLKNINLIIEKNKHIGIEGKTGEGKSTLIDLVLGLITSNEGEILVDGINIHKNKAEWQNMIGYVPQETFLNASSIKTNISEIIPLKIILYQNDKLVATSTATNKIVDSPF